MPVERIIKLGDLYELPTNNNAEIKCRYLWLLFYLFCVHI